MLIIIIIIAEPNMSHSLQLKGGLVKAQNGPAAEPAYSLAIVALNYRQERGHILK